MICNAQPCPLWLAWILVMDDFVQVVSGEGGMATAQGPIVWI